MISDDDPLRRILFFLRRGPAPFILTWRSAYNFCLLQVVPRPHFSKRHPVISPFLPNRPQVSVTPFAIGDPEFFLRFFRSFNRLRTFHYPYLPHFHDEEDQIPQSFCSPSELIPPFPGWIFRSHYSSFFLFSHIVKSLHQESIAVQLQAFPPLEEPGYCGDRIFLSLIMLL